MVLWLYKTSVKIKWKDLIGHCHFEASYWSKGKLWPHATLLVVSFYGKASQEKSVLLFLVSVQSSSVAISESCSCFRAWLSVMVSWSAFQCLKSHVMEPFPAWQSEDLIVTLFATQPAFLPSLFWSLGCSCMRSLLLLAQTWHLATENVKLLHVENSGFQHIFFFFRKASSKATWNKNNCFKTR